MIDFLIISTRSTKRGVIEVYPKFVIKRSQDLMIRGGDFYAIWLEERGLWSTDEQDALQLIDRELDIYAQENKNKYELGVKVLHMWDAESGMIDIWHRYCQKQMRDNFHMLDEKLIFSNDVAGKKDHASKRLPYPLAEGDISAYERLMSVIYAPEERHKIEWAIGSVVSGASKTLHKFMVLYGAAGTGKSTVLNIIQQLFEGYYCVFDARALGSSNNSFALEAFRTNPLVAIQHDGDLSKIEDNTRLNSVVSHEVMSVNEKFKAAYANRFKCFLFMGTNKPVKITDAKSGLIRRLIDVSPSGNKLGVREYTSVIKQIGFELGAIAWHCKEVYLAAPDKYDHYIPMAMLGASNDFYNFVIDAYHIFKKDDGVTLKAAWEMYKTYCDEAKVGYPFSQRIFKEELKNYFCDYKERFGLEDGTRVRSFYSGFRTEKFEERTVENEQSKTWIKFGSNVSMFDRVCEACAAQYATSRETPAAKWDKVTMKLKDIDTLRIHYVKPPADHIVIDFDIPDAGGGKSLQKNITAASKFPPTYAELSKSGGGVHLHYIYTGDVSALNRVYADHIEVKTFTGNSALRRKLTKCNDLPIAVISSGLPLKNSLQGTRKGDDNKVVNFDAVKSEKGLRALVKRNLNKEIHAGTKPSVDFIFKILDEAYASGMTYDLTDMRNAVLGFAANSTNQADYCIKLVDKMRFKSENISATTVADTELIFFDLEVFPNLLLVNWKAEGEGKPVVRMINPEAAEIEELLRFRLVGFNCRRYDNHILYARLIGYTVGQLYSLSQKIISGSANCFFGEAYNISYTDVYDFSVKKQSLKKFEIELGLSHKELGLPWDKPVPEELWIKVAEYCDNDVIATEAVFNARKGDFTARQILAELAGMTVNDTTNTLTTRIIFGGERKPQGAFKYRFMGDENSDVEIDFDDEYTVFNKEGKPIFPGYTFEGGKSVYRGEEAGEGGYVYAEPGIYGKVAVFDIASMHPSSIVAEELFGPEYTQRFKDILDVRIAIKHKDFAKAGKMLGGALKPYLTDENTAKDLAAALKIAINSVYGLTAASFDNPFRDIRNKDNIVAKRGALFMINLKHRVQASGCTVAHIKTDSIKIPQATYEVINFIAEYGRRYGYTFEFETVYERFCLVNDAVYIAKEDYEEPRYENGKYIGPWVATGAQFAVPYVFKTLFSKEDICFGDLCETKAVTTALYLDFNESLPEGEHDYRFIGKVGRFCPVKPGCGGGALLRETVKKGGEKGYNAVAGSKGYRWMEADMVLALDKQDDIDLSYYDKLVDAAIKTISAFGNFEEFVS